jgi:hypothetical protein
MKKLGIIIILIILIITSAKIKDNKKDIENTYTKIIYDNEIYKCYLDNDDYVIFNSIDNSMELIKELNKIGKISNVCLYKEGYLLIGFEDIEVEDNILIGINEGCIVR